MQVMVSWIEPDTERASSAVEWPDDVFDQVPVVRDKIVEPLGNGALALRTVQ
jgi:hypothetical protein